jgi:hypothetical protein
MSPSPRLCTLGKNLLDRGRGSLSRASGVRRGYCYGRTAIKRASKPKGSQAVQATRYIRRSAGRPAPAVSVC